MIKKKEHRPIHVETKVNLLYEDQKKQKMLKAKKKLGAV